MWKDSNMEDHQAGRINPRGTRSLGEGDKREIDTSEKDERECGWVEKHLGAL